MSFSTRFNDGIGAIGFAATYGGSGALLAAGYLGYTGEVMSAVPVALIGLALLVGRAASLEVDIRGRATSPLAKRVATVGVVALLVSTAALSGVIPGASPVQEARAEWSEECDITDSLLGAAYNTISGADTGCRWIAGDHIDYENQTKTDAYATGLGMKDAAESYTTSVSNFHQNTRTVAMSKAKITLINGLNNGTSESVTHSEVNSTIRDYNSRMQMEVINDWNAKMQQIDYLDNTSVGLRVENDEGATVSTLTLESVDYDLVNGSTVTITILGLDGESTYEQLSPVGSGESHNFDGYGTSMVPTHGEVQIQDPDTGDWATILQSGDYSTNYSDEDGNYPTGRMLLENPPKQSQWAVDNMAPYVPEVYDQYTAGEIDSVDLAKNDPSVIAQEASTSFNSTGYYGYAGIQMAAIGASGNVNVSHTITTGDGTTLEGSLYYTADDMPADGWVTGTTYNVSNFNGTFYMAVQKEDGNATVVDLANYGETFTIDEATNTKSGDEVEATKVQTYTYESTNASALEEEIERLRELREEYENVDASGSTGCVAACGDGSSVLPKETGLYVVLGLAAIILLARP